MRIAVIDSGVSPEMKNRYPDLHGLGITCTGGEIKTEENMDDDIGHGTSIVGIIKGHVPDLDITVVKIDANEKMESDCDSMIAALRYTCDVIKPDIINLSMCVCDTPRMDDLYEVCKDLHDRGIVLVAAFDNEGAVAYPAAFDCVVGVTTSALITNNNMFFPVHNKYVNVCAKGRSQRVRELKDEVKIRMGDSLACAHLTGILAQCVKTLGKSATEALEQMGVVRNIKINEESPEENTSAVFEMGKAAAIFPYNKEMQGLTRFSDLLNFEIAGIFDIRRSGKIGMKVPVKEGGDEKVFFVRNVDSLDETEYDMLIIGHTDELSYADGSFNAAEIIKSNLRKGKRVYSLDDFEDEEIGEYTKKGMFFSPKIIIDGEKIVPFGKLYRTSVPVVGVFGTHSRQGKWTLQLELRKRFLNDGYNLGQLGTEPTALLFGMDACYHFGYNSSSKYNYYERISHINSLIHDMSMQKKEIILSGSQSQTITSNTANIDGFAIEQYIFLQALQPDAVVLAIRYEDETSYIGSTIRFIEAAVDCRVLGLVLFPIKEKLGNDRDLKISDAEITELRNKIWTSIGRTMKIYRLDCKEDLDSLYDSIIDYFAESEDVI